MVDTEGIYKMVGTEFLQAAMAIAIGGCGFFIKRMMTLIDECQRRMTCIEIEVSRMKQSERDLADRLERIEEKLDKLLEKR